MNKEPITVKRMMALVGALVSFSFLIACFLPLNAQVIVIVFLACLSLLFFFFRSKFPVKRFWAALLLCAMSICYFVGYTALFYTPATSYIDQTVPAAGTITEISADPSGKYFYTIRVHEMNDEHVKPFYLQTCTEDQLNATYGDHISFTSTFASYASGDTLSPDDYLRSQGIFLNCYLEEDAQVDVTPPTIRSPFAYCKELRDYLVDVMDTSVAVPYCYVADGILFGVTDFIPTDIVSAFRGSGIAHLLAVSGLHFAMMASIIFAILAFFRLPKKITAVIGFVFLLAFSAMAGFTPSVVRSFIMMSVALFAPLVMRRHDPINTLGIAAVLLLLPSPYTIMNVSFLLSFASSLGILVLSPRLNAAFQRRFLCQGEIKKGLIDSLSISIAATLATIPITLVFFSSVSLIGPLTNILAVPLSGFVLFFGVFTMVFGAFLPILGNIFGLATGALSFLLVKTAEFFNAIPFSHLYFSYDFLLFLLLGGGMIVCICCLAKHKEIMIKTGALLFSILFLSSCLSYDIINRDVAHVEVLGNSSGYSVIVSYKQHAVVIGCGGNGYSGENTYRALCKQNVFQIDALILPTLSKEDARGAPFLIQNFPIETIYSPDSGTMYSQVQSAAQENEIDCYALDPQIAAYSNMTISFDQVGDEPLITLAYPNYIVSYAESSETLTALAPTDKLHTYITKDEMNMDTLAQGSQYVILLNNHDIETAHSKNVNENDYQQFDIARNTVMAK